MASLPPPLVEGALKSQNTNSQNNNNSDNNDINNNIADMTSSSSPSSIKSGEQQQFDIESATTGTTRAQRHFARLCSILADPSVDLDTVCMTLRRGVPDELRMDFWRLALGVLPLGDPSKREESTKQMAEQYQQLLELTCKDIKDGGDAEEGVDPFPIDADIPRTMPTLHFFASPAHYNISNNKQQEKQKEEKEEKKIESVEKEKEEVVSPASPAVAAASPPASPHSIVKDRYGNKHFTPSQIALRRVLFLYSRVHRGRGYAQGMNEMVGLLLWAACNGNASSVNQAEADVFFCFQSLMQYCGDHFCSIPDHQGETGLGETLKTFSYLLRLCDPELSEHLHTKNMIMPEFYAFRWISILFAVEFPVADVLSVWDFMLSFTDSVSTAGLFVAVAMLVNIREKLLESDGSTCIEMLQNYPPQIEVSDVVATAQALIDRHTVKPHLWSAAGASSSGGNYDNDDESNNNNSYQQQQDGGDSSAGVAHQQKRQRHNQQHDTSDDDSDGDVGKKIVEGANAAMSWLSTKANSIFSKKENSNSNNESRK